MIFSTFVLSRSARPTVTAPASPNQVILKGRPTSRLKLALVNMGLAIVDWTNKIEHTAKSRLQRREKSAIMGANEGSMNGMILGEIFEVLGNGTPAVFDKKVGGMPSLLL